MQKVGIAINGMGRIGKMTLRAAIQQGMLENIVAVNDLVTDIDYLAYLLKHDSTHGLLDLDIHAEDKDLVVNGHHIKCYSERSPLDLKWDDGSVQIVLECTGIFTTIEKAKQHIHGSVKKVIISAPSADAPMFVYGVNHEKYTNDMDIISNASCTTNCLAPICKVLNEKFGIERGLMTTVHSVTATQFVQDTIGKKDRRNGRSCMTNIVPASTGAAKAVGKVIPELNGKVTGMSFRVPTIDVSVVDLTVQLKTETDYESICKAMKEYSENQLKGILCYTEDDVVSSDFLGTTQTSTFDAKAGIMLDKTFVKIISWYDNEVGYSNKLLELAKLVISKL